MGDAVRVAIAEDHFLVREGVRRSLADADGIEVVASVRTADELLDAVERLHPEVVVTDIRMPPGHGTEGIEAAHRIRLEQGPLAQLTERELDVLREMAQGRTNAAIADVLHLSESSVEKYATAVFAKLGLRDEPGVHRRVTAVLTLLRELGTAGEL